MSMAMEGQYSPAGQPAGLVVHKTSTAIAIAGAGLATGLGALYTIGFVRLLVKVFANKTYLETIVFPDRIVTDPLMFYLCVILTLVMIGVAGMSTAFGFMGLTFRSGKLLGTGVLHCLMAVVFGLAAAYNDTLSAVFAAGSTVTAGLCLYLGYRQAAAQQAFKHGVAEAWLPCKASEVHLYDPPLPGEDPNEMRHWPFSSLPRREENWFLPHESTMRTSARKANFTGWGSAIAYIAVTLGIVLGFWAPLKSFNPMEAPAQEDATAPSTTAPSTAPSPTETAPAASPAPADPAAAPSPAAPTTP